MTNLRFKERCTLLMPFNEAFIFLELEDGTSLDMFLVEIMVENSHFFIGVDLIRSGLQKYFL